MYIINILLCIKQRIIYLFKNYNVCFRFFSVIRENSYSRAADIMITIDTYNGFYILYYGKRLADDAYTRFVQTILIYKPRLTTVVADDIKENRSR